MADVALADAGFLIALLDKKDANHRWAVATATAHPPKWLTCEAVLSQAFFVLGPKGRPALGELLRRDAVAVAFRFQEERDPTLSLMNKYASVPMSLADACLVRMAETIASPIVLTTDGDFRIYRRHGRQMIPAAMPQEA